MGKEKLDKLVKDTEMELASEEGITSTIKSMLENKAYYDFITKVTGKTIEEIKEIESSIKE